VDYAWPAEEKLGGRAPAREVRLLAPFDPIVWDRKRFVHLWGWPYRFEAYTPPAKRRLGYYALPLLWGHEVVGWANVKAEAGSDKLQVEVGLATLDKRTPDFTDALEEELERMRAFLGVARVARLKWLRHLSSR
jgi:uncharacterized protein YcaQ